MAGIMEELSQIPDGRTGTVLGIPAIESEITLLALRQECENDKEFAALLESAASELSLYGVISDESIATEVVKKIQVGDWKTANFNRIARRTAIRLAMINNDALYTKYRKYRDLLLQTREKIYQKYGNKAKVEARKIIKNARARAANINSDTGSKITEKIDKEIAAADAAPASAKRK